MDSTAIVLLAGGRARRFAGKLEHLIDGTAMVQRSLENARAAGWPVYIAGKGSFSRELDARLDAPLIVDRRSGRGPLHAFLWACNVVDAERIFAIAADQPHLDAQVLRRLAEAWEPGNEAVVPQHGNEIEPLASLYDRRAVLREGFELRRTRSGAMHELLERLATRFVRCDAHHFLNVNRREDLA